MQWDLVIVLLGAAAVMVTASKGHSIRAGARERQATTTVVSRTYTTSILEDPSSSQEGETLATNNDIPCEINGGSTGSNVLYNNTLAMQQCRFVQQYRIEEWRSSANPTMRCDCQSLTPQEAIIPTAVLSCRDSSCRVCSTEQGFCITEEREVTLSGEGQDTQRFVYLEGVSGSSSPWNVHLHREQKWKS